MSKLSLLGAVLATICSVISMPSSAALINNGGGLIYDDVLKITWAQPDTFRSWGDANAWAAGLTLGGVSGWRLPYISVAEGAGPFTGDPVDCNTATELACRDNELGYMFYHNLGGTYKESILDSGDPDLALFPTLKSQGYWSGTEFDSSFAWKLIFHSGELSLDGTGEVNYGVHNWAVHAGNIHPIPIPAAVWLFGSGLLGLVGMERRKKAE